MADTGKKAQDQRRPDLPGGGMNSEHEYDTSGMRGITREYEHELAEAAGEEAVREDVQQILDVEQGKADDPETRHLATTSYTHMDRVAEQGGTLAARTAQEMSLHDELSRTPTGDAKKKGNQDADKK